MNIIIMGQPASKKNSMQLVIVNDRFIPVPSKSYRTWMKIARPQVRAQVRDLDGLPMDRPVHLKVLAYRHTKRKIDLSNIYAAVEDMLQAFRILKDDSLVEHHDGSRKILGVPADEARVEITLEEI